MSFVLLGRRPLGCPPMETSNILNKLWGSPNKFRLLRHYGLGLGVALILLAIQPVDARNVFGPLSSDSCCALKIAVKDCGRLRPVLTC